MRDKTKQLFSDRREAGRELAEALKDYTDREGVIVLGLAPGGLPVAYEVAPALDAPLDVFTVRKLGVPGHRELGMGAIATGGVRVLNEDVLEVEDESDDAVCLMIPEPLMGIGGWYEDSSQTSDGEVRQYLQGSTEPWEHSPQ